jgi:hypothetical protein
VTHVTVQSEDILARAVTRLRERFPGASLNEVLRVAALGAKIGFAEAERLVFGEKERPVKANKGRVSCILSKQEQEIFDNTVTEVPLSIAVRLGLSDLAGNPPHESLATAFLARGGSRPGAGRPRKESATA